MSELPLSRQAKSEPSDWQLMKQTKDTLVELIEKESRQDCAGEGGPLHLDLDLNQMIALAKKESGGGFCLCCTIS